MDKDSLNEIGLIVVVSFFLFFVSTNVNPALGNIYQGLAVVGISMLLADKMFGKKEIKLVNKNINWLTAIFIAGVSYVILILSSYFTTYLSKVVPLTEILGLLGASAPVFASSQSINFLIFAVVIPIIETVVIFALAIDLFSSVFNISLNRMSFKLILLFLILSFSFLIFHINSKGITAEASLILVFIMAFISCWLAFIYKEARIPIIFHCICNFIASLPIFSNFVT